MELDAVDTPIGRSTPWYRRVWALVAGSALAVWVGAATATIVGFGGAYLVITLTRMLKR